MTYPRAHLALYVDRAILTGVGACGDAHRKAEALIPQVHYGQAIELADFKVMD